LNSRINDEDYSSSVVSLVSKAIGVDEASVSVEMLPFLESADGDGAPGAFAEHASLVDGLKKKELVKTLIIAGTILVLAVFILRFLQVMLLRRGGFAVSSQAAGEAVLTDGSALQEELLDIMASAKSKNKEKIERFVDTDPAAAAQLLRNWLMDDDM
jgi:flagellar biosynthesis/type III secretory pathway M-ring protein FliF/YscJ